MGSEIKAILTCALVVTLGFTLMKLTNMFDVTGPYAGPRIMWLAFLMFATVVCGSLAGIMSYVWDKDEKK